MLWNILAPLVGAAFITLGIIFTYVAVKARNSQLPFRSALGVRAPKASESPENWAKAHRSVWPLFALAATIAFFHGVCLPPAALLVGEGNSPAGYIAVLTISGAIVVTALRVLAEKAARAALNN